MPPQSLMWKGRIGVAGSLALVAGLALTFAAMRAVGMLGPAGLRWLLPLGFVLMAAMPWILLSPEGRRRIGLVRPARAQYVAYGTVSGMLAALACFGLGLAMFGTSADNWYISISNYYQRSFDTSGLTTAQLHLIFTVPAILFSPVGEEIFFRGLLQRALEQRLSARASTVIECGAFGLVHLCHHGIFAGAAGLVLLPVSGALWVALMFAVGWMFAALRRRSASLYPAMAAHAAFNIAMNVAIFSWLWPPH